MVEISYNELNDLIFCLKNFISEQEIIFNKNYKYLKDNKKIVERHKLKQEQMQKTLQKLQGLTSMPSDFIIIKK